MWNLFSDGETIGPIVCLHAGVPENHGDDGHFHKPSELAQGERFQGRSVEAKLKGSLATIMKEEPLMCDIVRPHVMKPLAEAFANDLNFLLKLVLLGTQESSR